MPWDGAMNYEHFQLDELGLEHFQVKEVLRCVLHSVVYQRALGTLPAVEEESTLFEVAYLRVDHEAVRAAVEERLDAFASSLDQGTHVQSQVDLSFYERRQRKGLLGLHHVEERVCWERWSLPLNVRTRPYHHSKEREEAHVALEHALVERLHDVVSFCSEKKDHLPPIDALGADVLAFDVSATNAAEGWGIELFKRMLQATPPMPAVN